MRQYQQLDSEGRNKIFAFQSSTHIQIHKTLCIPKGQLRDNPAAHITDQSLIFNLEILSRRRKKDLLPLQNYL